MNLIENIIQLINDTLSNKIYGSNEYANEAIRQGIFEILGDSKTIYCNYILHQNEIAYIFEEVCRKNLFTDINNISVESKNGRLGECNVFVANESSLLFDKNYCQSLERGQEFLLQSGWIKFGFIDELNNFLNGKIYISKMMSNLQYKLRKEIYKRINELFLSIYEKNEQRNDIGFLNSDYKPIKIYFSGDVRINKNNNIATNVGVGIIVSKVDN